jgi:hypothetical protein
MTSPFALSIDGLAGWYEWVATKALPYSLLKRLFELEFNWEITLMSAVC